MGGFIFWTNTALTPWWAGRSSRSDHLGDASNPHRQTCCVLWSKHISTRHFNQIGSVFENCPQFCGGEQWQMVCVGNINLARVPLAGLAWVIDRANSLILGLTCSNRNQTSPGGNKTPKVDINGQCFYKRTWWLSLSMWSEIVTRNPAVPRHFQSSSSFCTVQLHPRKRFQRFPKILQVLLILILILQVLLKPTGSERRLCRFSAHRR